MLVYGLRRSRLGAGAMGYRTAAAMTIKCDSPHRARTAPASPAAIWAVRQLTGPTPSSTQDGLIFGEGMSLKNGIQRALKRLGKKEPRPLEASGRSRGEVPLAHVDVPCRGGGYVRSLCGEGRILQLEG